MRRCAAGCERLQSRISRGGSKTRETDLAVYVELEPIDRHRPFIDHLFILRDRGRLTGAGRNLFASPFSEIALVGRHLDDDSEDTDSKVMEGVVAWKAFHLPPRFGRQPRRHGFHGWMLGIRYRPLALDPADAPLVGLSETLQRQIGGRAPRSIRSDHRRFGCLDRASSQPPVQRRPGAPVSHGGERRGSRRRFIGSGTGPRHSRCLAGRDRRRRSPHAAAPLSQTHRACAQAICSRAAVQRRVEAGCPRRWKPGAYRVGIRLLRSSPSDGGSGPARRPVAAPVSCAGAAADRARRCPIFQRRRPSEPGTSARLRFRRSR